MGTAATHRHERTEEAAMILVQRSRTRAAVPIWWRDGRRPLAYLLPLVLLLAIAAPGCTSVTVRPVEPGTKLTHVCIQNNPKVLVSDFVPVVRDGLSRHRISSQVYAAVPDTCRYVLTYSAWRHWDFAPYLVRAELHIEADGMVIAAAEYHLRGNGGWSPMKWQSTKTKMDPVIDQLLSTASR